MTYDPLARRDTPLALKLKERIRREGPMTVAAYMQACLQDPEHGYYVKQPALGRAGDFVTAPEISQVFGELAGLWAAVVWQQMGSPERVNLVELGPGRGTLMRDALRAARKVSGFFNALHIHLVESSNVLRGEQERALAGCGRPVTFHTRLKRAFWSEEAIGSGPVILIGNEFLDTFGVLQFEFRDGVWRQRMIAAGADGNLQPDLNLKDVYEPSNLPPAPAPQEGDVFELAVDLAVFAGVYLAPVARSQPFAALFLDYGHEASGYGDTVQAICEHRAVSPYFAPGESDVTAQVDFEQFARACRNAEDGGLAVDGPVTQAEFLGRLGIIERASRLMSANPDKAGEIEMGVARLMAPQGMGTRFKAIGVRSMGLPVLPGFERERA